MVEAPPGLDLSTVLVLAHIDGVSSLKDSYEYPTTLDSAGGP